MLTRLMNIYIFTMQAERSENTVSMHKLLLVSRSIAYLTIYSIFQS